MTHPTQAWRRLPKLVRFLLAHGSVGFVVSAAFVGGFVLADPNGAGRLLLTGAGHWWPVVVLWFFSGLTFGTVQIGMATMLLGEDGGGRRPRGGPPGELVPIRIRSRGR